MTPSLSHAQTVALASDAGRKNREACIREAHSAFLHDLGVAHTALYVFSEELTVEGIRDARTAIDACRNHLNDMEIRLVAGGRRA